MPPRRIYLDSSVLGGAIDEEFQGDTHALVELIRARKIQAVILRAY